MSDQIRAEWREDLWIMDKLLRDAIGEVNKSQPPQAMGINVSISDVAPPMYLGGYGAVLTYDVNMQLTGAAPSAAGSTAEAASAPSAWERARRELTGEKSADAATSSDAKSTAKTQSRSARFNQVKLEQLVAVLQQSLLEAKNFRHLKAGEFVIVAVSGHDDAGKPIMLTLKVKKSDIDEAASGRLSPEDFKRRVEWHVG
jgi:hypothetical protein